MLTFQVPSALHQGRPSFLSSCICRVPIPRRPVLRRRAAHRSPTAPTAQASSQTPGADAIAHAQQGNFALAASAVSANSDTLSALDADARRAIARTLLNEITLARVAAAGETAELFDGGVNALYGALRSARLLTAFGMAHTAARPDGFAEKDITVEKLVTTTGLPLAALSPGKASTVKWNLAGIAAVSLTVAVTRALGVEGLAVPAIGVVGALLAVDQTLLRGSVFEAVSAVLTPKLRARIQATVLQHESGHFLVAYLNGLQISGYLLSGNDARKAKIPSFGQGGTLFLFPELQRELAKGQLKAETIDTWATVLMAGIASEALGYGQAKGGASDESMLIGLLSKLSWTPTRIKSEARYGVLRAVLLLRENTEAHAALMEKMRASAPIGDCIEAIERYVTAVKAPVLAHVAASDESVVSVDNDSEMERIRRREAQVLEELETVSRRLNGGNKNESTS
jgi:hypothetical protein